MTSHPLRTERFTNLQLSVQPQTQTTVTLWWDSESELSVIRTSAAAHALLPVYSAFTTGLSYCCHWYRGPCCSCSHNRKSSHSRALLFVGWTHFSHHKPVLRWSTFAQNNKQELPEVSSLHQREVSHVIGREHSTSLLDVVSEVKVQLFDGDGDVSRLHTQQGVTALTSLHKPLSICAFQRDSFKQDHHDQVQPPHLQKRTGHWYDSLQVSNTAKAVTENSRESSAYIERVSDHNFMN